MTLIRHLTDENAWARIRFMSEDINNESVIMLLNLDCCLNIIHISSKNRGRVLVKDLSSEEHYVIIDGKRYYVEARLDKIDNRWEPALWNHRYTKSEL